MESSFCAIANKQAGEDLIGTAGYYQTYVLIECPLPWVAKVFHSKSIPAPLRQYVDDIAAKRSVRFLAINRGVSSLNSTTLLVYERTLSSSWITESSANSEVIEGYRGFEFQLDDLTQVAECLEAHWQRDCVGQSITQKDILICTHGMRDRCCARFGQPFFRDTVRSAQAGKLPNTRVWKVSHIGGHRFAPTAISFPDGRYYGRLTAAALEMMITRQGSISLLGSVYRGWGLLPAPLQVLERQLMLQQGWSWFDSRVRYQILIDTVCERQGDDSGKNLHRLSVELSFVPKVSQERLSQQAEAKTTSLAKTYRAELIQDPDRTVHAKASCDSLVTKPYVKYRVVECVQISRTQSATVPNPTIETSPAV